MAQAVVPLLGFNAGVVSVEAASRTDMERMRVAARLQNNMLPRLLGSMAMRPGTAYIGATKSNARAQFIPFVYSVTQKALIELTASKARVWVDDALVTRPSVSTAISNGTFDTDLTGWTDYDEAGATSEWGSAAMKLTGSGTTYARRYQQVTVASGDQNVEHALRIIVGRGPVLLRVGTTAANQTYIRETTLRTGCHSLSFTPSGDFYVVVYSKVDAPRYIDSITVEAAGVVELDTPWGADDLGLVKYDQSADVIYCARSSGQQQRIERRSFRSWSVVDYAPDDGPFGSLNIDGPTLSVSSTTGLATMTASRDYFTSGDVGRLFKMTHNGQTAAANLAAENTFTSAVRVSGISGTGGTRVINLTIEGTWTGTLTLQKAFGEPVGWSDVGTYVGNVTTTIADAADNQIVYYRIGFKTGDYTSDTAEVSLTSPSSVQSGVVRVTGFTSSTSVEVEVLATIGKASEATSDWRAGEWSDRSGWPDSVRLHDGRLFWGMGDRVYGSVSDAYESFDQETEGDSGPIVRSIALGPADGIYWMLSLQRLLVGGVGQEVSVRSSSFDEPLTPTQFSAKRCSSRGGQNIQAQVIDSIGVFVQNNKRRVYELTFSVESQDYVSRDLTRLCPKICYGQVRAFAVQRKPETRLWFVLEDGTIAVMLYERAENVVAWSTIDTDGSFEDVCIMPGSEEDDVYFVVNRTISASTKRYVEKLGKESECVGGTLNKIMDCHWVYSGGSTTNVSGGSHLNGKQVVVWGGGAALRDQSNLGTVSGGVVTVGSAVTSAVAGLPYNGRYTSAKLAYAAKLGTALGQRKRIDHLGLILDKTNWKGLKIGRDFSNLRRMPKMYRGEELADTALLEEYDFDLASFNGGFDPDSRLCVEVQAPYAATVCALAVSMSTNEKPAVADAA